MHPAIIFILGIIAGLAIARLAKAAPKPRFLPDRQRLQKRKNKERIIAYLQERESAANEELQELLGVSDATVTNYMDELEAEGAARQVGDLGRGVRYILK